MKTEIINEHLKRNNRDLLRFFSLQMKSKSMMKKNMDVFFVK